MVLILLYLWKDTLKRQLAEIFWPWFFSWIYLLCTETRFSDSDSRIDSDSCFIFAKLFQFFSYSLLPKFKSQKVTNGNKCGLSPYFFHFVWYSCPAETWPLRQKKFSGQPDEKVLALGRWDLVQTITRHTASGIFKKLWVSKKYRDVAVVREKSPI